MMTVAIALAGLSVVTWVFSYYNFRDAKAEREIAIDFCSRHDQKIRDVRAQLADLKAKGLKVDATCPKCKQHLRILAPFDVKDTTIYPDYYNDKDHRPTYTFLKSNIDPKSK